MFIWYLQKMKLRHVGIVVKDLRRSIKLYQDMGWEPIERDTIRIVKMRNKHGETLELVKGRWKPHISVTLSEDEDNNLWEVVHEHPNHS